jgi:hypothetical protein
MKLWQGKALVGVVTLTCATTSVTCALFFTFRSGNLIWC